MSIEKHFDIPFISALALREKQIQQNYRPIIAVHKWFARRPGTLFRGLILSEYSDRPLQEAFYSSNDLKRINIADPFMGGGTPLIEANRLGCNVTGYDINPMAYWIVNREIEHLNLPAYRKSAEQLTRSLEMVLGSLYRTQCQKCGSNDAHIKYFLWIKKKKCAKCDVEFDLFPGYLLAKNKRHTENILICSNCGDLNGVNDPKNPGNCCACGTRLSLSGPAKRNKCACPKCKHINSYPDPNSGPPSHRMFAIEYYCRSCKATHTGRFFKRPDNDDLNKFENASNLLKKIGRTNVPEDDIPPGDETTRLLRWGYRYYSEMFNERQLLGLELSCQAISKEKDERIRNALITNFSDLLRYQNMLCRYDTMALKSLDIFSVHGFPIGLVQCESNFIGIPNGRGTSVGSGGWSNIIEKFLKAKHYCDFPFETRHDGKKKIQVPISNEWIGDQKNGYPETIQRTVSLHCQSATMVDLPMGSLDGVFTDPPYFGNVQYAELIDFCYVWVRKMVDSGNPAFHSHSTRNQNELTGNITMERGFDHFTEGLSVVFKNMANALKPGKPMVFTYHHNKLEAYYPLTVAILDAGLTCTASIPCPAEMGSSIHINGTVSSVVDTVLVCRSTGKIPRKWIVDTPEQISALVKQDIENLKSGGLKPSRGDTLCIIYGHLARLAVWRLRLAWDINLSTLTKLAIVAKEIERCGTVKLIEDHLTEKTKNMVVHENVTSYGEKCDAIPF